MRIMLAGFGVVGRALAIMLDERGGELYRRYGLQPRLVGVLDRGGAAVSESGLSAAELIAAKEAHGTVAALPARGEKGADPEAIIDGSDADVLVVATPSALANPTPDIGLLKAGFRSGKHAVSVNKAPLAVAMPALLELARYNRREFRFSGTVGAGTPVLAFARECAKSDPIQRVLAVLNGTTNFILWRMHTAGAAFDDALAEAQRLGYAETDPSTDIDGIDTATKVVILANHVLGRSLRLADVAISGIRGLGRDAIEAARRHGRVVKLVGEIAERLSVAPQEVEAGGGLDVPSSLNAVSLTLRSGSEVTLRGRGAGGPETATAIVRDLIDIWNVMGTHA
jgi:homoserine dehydrogenase